MIQFYLKNSKLIREARELINDEYFEMQRQFFDTAPKGPIFFNTFSTYSSLSTAVRLSPVSAMKTKSVECLAALDNVLANSPMKKYVQVGRLIYSSADAYPLSKTNFSTVSAFMAQVGLVLNVGESFSNFSNLGGHSLMELVLQENDGKDPCNSHHAMREVLAKLEEFKLLTVHNGIP